jgi:cytochrome c-type biogenesis protein CcmH/NrfG
LAECHEALRLNPQSDDGHFCLGGLAEMKGNLPEALREYGTARTMNPTEPEYQQAYQHVLNQMKK